MKKLHLILLLAGILCARADPLRTNITLIWNYAPDLVTNTTFVLRCTTNLSTPHTNWPIVQTVRGQTNCPLNIQPGAYFFICQASNLWGVSDPSNVASTPAPPRSDYSLGVK